MTSLTASWTAFMGEIDAIAPITRGLVKPPSGRIEALAATLPNGLTVELQEWFELHDGVGSTWECELIPGHLLVGVDESLELNQLTLQIWSEFADDDTGDLDPDAPAGSVAETWLKEFIYVTNDTTGGGLFVDTRPGDLQGCVRLWDKTNADGWEDASPITANLGDLITAVTESIVSGGPCLVFGYPMSPRSTAGTLEWTDD